MNYEVSVDAAIQAERQKALQWHDLFAKTPRQEVEKGIILKAQNDPDFLRRLVRDPKTTISEFVGVPLPDALQFNQAGH